ncbi:MAG: Flp family type IVb pilin [Armatimonadetes bacterium]|nr:MAG: Flp family type IVb pilin [Armatimonadota bacterium]
MNSVTQIPRLLVARCQLFLAGERGASMVEYALLIGLIAMVALISVTLFGDALGDKNSGIAGSIMSATS